MSITGSSISRRWIGLLLGSCITTSAQAQYDPLAMLQEASSAASAAEPVPTAGEPQAYGRRGFVEWTVGGMVGAEFGITELAFVRNRVDWFVQDRFSLGLQFEAGGAWVGGTGDTGSIGVASCARWHFLERESWTLFGEVGIGLAWFGSPLPAGGTRLNFSPQAGLGATFRIDDRLRLHVACGWYHLSNARTSNSNPGFDGLAVQVGVGIGF